MGLGTIQISSGLEYVFSIPQSFSNQIIIISLITLIGLTSVCLGLDKGIKRLSQINMILASSLMAFIFIFGPTVFILNALIQNFGSYVNTLIESATWTEV